MNPYERQVLRAWAKRDKESEPLHARLVRGLTGRFRLLQGLVDHSRARPVFDKAREAAREAIIRALEQATTAKRLERVEETLRSLGAGAVKPSEIRMLPLEVKDKAADQLFGRQVFTVGAEGAIAGLASSICELTPGLQGFVLPTVAADLAATLYLMTTGAVTAAYAYGYTAYGPEDLPHLLFAMAPHTEDLRLAEAKVAAHLALLETGLTATRVLSDHITVRLLYAQQPTLRALIDAVAARLVSKMATREASLLLPVVGALLQGGINVAFARESHQVAKRYFQRLHLVDRYGEAYVDEQFAALSGVQARPAYA